jgi:hypothetical protein
MSRQSGVPGPAAQAGAALVVAAVLVGLGWLASLVWPVRGPWLVAALAGAVLLVRVEVWGRSLSRRPATPPADPSPAVLELTRRVVELTEEQRRTAAAVERGRE